MGSTQSNLQSKLLQEEDYINFCRIIPDDMSIKLSYDQSTGKYTWESENTKEEPCDDNIVKGPCEDINYKTSLLLSAAAYTGDAIDHLLDGYSAGIVTRAGMENDKPVFHISSKPINDEKILYLKEKAGEQKITGLVTSEMSLLKKLCGGNLFKFLSGGRAYERATAHQPFYYPQERSVIYASGTKYHSLKYNFENDKIVLSNNGWNFKPSRKKYYSMHPHWDHKNQKFLTYTFTYGVLKKYTKLTFYEFGEDSAHPIKTKYKINDRVILHMFGFTENYFILFANPLKLEKCGQAKIIFGKPLLRTLDDNYTSNLIIHFIPRNNSKQAFSVDTNHQGVVYHTINCYETNENKIIIDAYVSQLNAHKEASQFEIDHQHKIYDNNGDPYRFIINATGPDPCKMKLIASMLDSTIDFHCINPIYFGLKYKYSWIVGYERIRNENGDVKKALSTLYKVHMEDDTINFNPMDAVTHFAESTEWTDGSCYLRTPLFVPKLRCGDVCGDVCGNVCGNVCEDDGYIFIWSYTFENDSKIDLMIFDAQDLKLLWTIPMPKKYHIPYSIHSWVY